MTGLQIKIYSIYLVPVKLNDVVVQMPNLRYDPVNSLRLTSHSSTFSSKMFQISVGSLTRSPNFRSLNSRPKIVE